MSILIKGVEMPDVRQAYAGLIIRWDGKVYPFSPPQGYELGDSVATAVPVPPHGRLIDADAISYHKIMFLDDDYYYGTTKPYIDRMPTIISEEEE